VALVAVRVADAIGVVDARMCHVLLPVVRVGVAQAARIDSAEGIVGEEERPSPVRPERKLYALETAPVEELAPLRPTLVVDFGRNRIARRRGGQHVGDEALVPAADRMVERETVGRAPMPGERDPAALGVPVPLRLAPEIGDTIANAFLFRGIAVEIGARAKQPLEQERAL